MSDIFTLTPDLRPYDPIVPRFVRSAGKSETDS
jgi:hypothetical protein